tara:strand:- start:164 stop:331 length:168 start_codon:yes stop_codon:yes gene_type:complete
VTTATSAELSTLAGPYLAVMRRENSNVTSGATTKLDATASKTPSAPERQPKLAGF